MKVNGAIAQLGERQRGTLEAAGSSPASSIQTVVRGPENCVHGFAASAPRTLPVTSIQSGRAESM